jgi:hydroxymethylbilane synthase
VTATAPPALRLGTRGSPLAVRQAGVVAAAIHGEVETVVLRTAGDRGEGADKRRWVDTIEAALLETRIDLAVHSAKDVPSELAGGLELIGAPARADPRDALCGAPSLAALAPGARVGTSSVRRAAQLRALREDLEIVPLHGNLDTRLRRLEDGDFDAIVLAVAGLERLDRGSWTALDDLIPAAGQGTLALEARVGDTRVGAAVAELRDTPAERSLAAERALVHRLGAGCGTPVGAWARDAGGRALELRAFIGTIDGGHWIRDQAVGDDPVALGETVAERLLRCGAGALLG